MFPHYSSTLFSSFHQNPWRPRSNISYPPIGLMTAKCTIHFLQKELQWTSFFWPQFMHRPQIPQATEGKLSCGWVAVMKTLEGKGSVFSGQIATAAIVWPSPQTAVLIDLGHYRREIRNNNQAVTQPQNKIAGDINNTGSRKKYQG